MTGKRDKTRDEKKSQNIYDGVPPLSPPETKIIDGVEVRIIRIPFMYYNTKSMSESYRGERKLVIGGNENTENTDVYFSDEYQTPRKGFKLHPALRQSLKRGEKHKPYYCQVWDALDDRQ
jgi:hypothetical protein